MLDIAIIAVDKVRSKDFLGAASEYLKRLSPYAKIKVEEIAPEPFKNEGDKIKAKKKEGEKIIRALDKYRGAEIICLTETGKLMDSVSFAKWLDLKANGKIVFVIAGALGFDGAVIKKSSGSLSLSTLTFPHELARVVLLEQLYRAACISKGKEYHY